MNISQHIWPQYENCDHANNLVPYFSEGETDFKLCKQCGLVLRQPMPTESELSELYGALYNDTSIAEGLTVQESGAFAISQYAKYLCSHVFQHGGRVLDYGCGSGALVQQLHRYGVEAVGVEASENARLYCKRERHITLLSSVDEIRNKTLDAIVMIEVIEHLSDPYSTLVQLRQKLRSGGMLFLTTPNRLSLRARIEGGYWREASKKFHLVLFDQPSLRGLMTATGFVGVCQVRYSPVQRDGLLRLGATRLQQLFGVGGTLCFVAKAP